MASNLVANFAARNQQSRLPSGSWDHVHRKRLNQPPQGGPSGCWLIGAASTSGLLLANKPSVVVSPPASLDVLDFVW